MRSTRTRRSYINEEDEKDDTKLDESFCTVSCEVMGSSLELSKLSAGPRHLGLTVNDVLRIPYRAVKNAAYTGPNLGSVNDHSASP